MMATLSLAFPLVPSLFAPSVGAENKEHKDIRLVGPARGACEDDCSSSGGFDSADTEFSSDSSVVYATSFRLLSVLGAVFVSRVSVFRRPLALSGVVAACVHLGRLRGRAPRPCLGSPRFLGACPP